MIKIGEWKKSSFSGNGGSCVSVLGHADGSVFVSDGSGPILHFTAAEWDAFLGGVKAGEFDQFAE